MSECWFRNVPQPGFGLGLERLLSHHSGAGHVRDHTGSRQLPTARYF